MDGTRDHFLSCTTGPGDENGSRAGRHHFDQAEDFLHFLGGTDEGAERAGIAQLAARDLQFHLGAEEFTSLLQNRMQSVRVNRFRDVIVRTHAHGLHCTIDRALCGHHDHRYRLIALGIGQAFQQFHPTHARHLQVGHDNRRRPLRDLVPSLDAVRGRLHTITPGG